MNFASIIESWLSSETESLEAVGKRLIAMALIGMPKEIQVSLERDLFMIILARKGDAKFLADFKRLLAILEKREDPYLNKMGMADKITLSAAIGALQSLLEAIE